MDPSNSVDRQTDGQTGKKFILYPSHIITGRWDRVLMFLYNLIPLLYKLKMVNFMSVFKICLYKKVILSMKAGEKTPDLNHHQL